MVQQLLHEFKCDLRFVPLKKNFLYTLPQHLRGIAGADYGQMLKISRLLHIAANEFIDHNRLLEAVMSLRRKQILKLADFEDCIVRQRNTAADIAGKE
ncbi:hypothetical protein D3C87_1788400 [compost metagenome]